MVLIFRASVLACTMQGACETMSCSCDGLCGRSEGNVGANHDRDDERLAAGLPNRLRTRAIPSRCFKHFSTMSAIPPTLICNTINCLFNAPPPPLQAF